MGGIVSRYTDQHWALWRALEENDASDSALTILQGMLASCPVDSKEGEVFNIVYENMTLFEKAIHSRKFEVFKFLIDNGVSRDMNNLYTNMYYEIAGHGTVSMLNYVIVQPWYIDGFSSRVGGTIIEKPMYYAVRYNRTDMITRLLELPGNSINEKIVMARGFTAIHVAAEFSAIETFNFLVEMGADTAAVTYEGTTCLMLGLMHGRREFVRMLIEREPDRLAIAREMDKLTALHIATHKKFHDEMHRILSTGKVDVNAQEGGGNTALMVAASLNDVTAVNILLEFGASKEPVNTRGLTALGIAQFNGFKSLFT